MNRLDPDHRLPDAQVLVLSLDNYPAWKTACELVLSAGMRDGIAKRKMLSEVEIRVGMPSVKGRNGHWRHLRHIYGAAYSGITLTQTALKATMP